MPPCNYHWMIVRFIEGSDPLGLQQDLIEKSLLFRLTGDVALIWSRSPTLLYLESTHWKQSTPTFLTANRLLDLQQIVELDRKTNLSMYKEFGNLINSAQISLKIRCSDKLVRIERTRHWAKLCSTFRRQYWI